MAANDNKSEDDKKSPLMGLSSIFTRNKDQGAPADAEAPAVVDGQKQEAESEKQESWKASKPASWSTPESSADLDSTAEVGNQESSKVTNSDRQQMGKVLPFPSVQGESVTEDNKLSTQEQEQVNDLIVQGSEYWKKKAGATGPEQIPADNEQAAASAEPTTEHSSEEMEEPRICSEVKFNLPASAFSLVSFFPDSHYAVILKNGLYYAANLGTEVVEPTPYINFETLIVADGLVVLAVTELSNSESLLFLTDRFEGKRFRKPSEAKLEKMLADCMEDGSYQFSIGHETFSLLSKAQHKEVDTRTGFFAYPSGTFIYDTNGYLVFEEPNGTELLLADAHGCYVGFYLPLVHEVDEIKILLGPDVFVNPRRLTQTLMVVTKEETKEQSLLTCSRPMLVELMDLGIKDASQIEVSNGVAMITQEVKGSTCINVFTPKHQRIIIDRGIKIDTLAIGNGVYLPTEGVMLLDDGRLLFAREEEDGSVFIRGKRVDLPQQFLEIN